MNTRLANVLYRNKANFHAVVNFNSVTDHLLQLDFTINNSELNSSLIADTEKFSQYINQKLAGSNAKFGIGGYNENRILYKRSSHFDTPESLRASLAGLSGHEEKEDARCIHLGIDIWGPAGTQVYTPLGGVVHSFANNDHFGDYGATIILQHQLDTINFHTLYGHLSQADLAGVQEGKYINRGELIGHFGNPEENGNWPPHLHFQIIEEMDVLIGDYPGVCAKSDANQFLNNCPDPDIILDMIKFAVKSNSI